MRGEKRLIKIGVAVVLILLLLTSFLAGACAPKPEEWPKILITTAIPKQVVTFGAYYSPAKVLGWFEDERINVSIENVAPAIGWAMVADGDAQAVVLAPEFLLNTEAKGQKTGMVMAYQFYTRPWFWLAVTKNSPITDVSQLKGKKIGLGSMGPPHLPNLELYLREGGLTSDDVELVAIGSGLVGVQALDSGEIDVFQSIAGEFGTFERQGFDIRYLPEPALYDTLFGPCVYIHQRTIDDPVLQEAMGKYFRTLAKSALFIQHNPEAMVRLQWEAVPEGKPTGISEQEAFDTAMNTLRIVQKYTVKNVATQKWGVITLEAVTAYADYMGVTDKIPHLNSLITDVFTETMNDWDEEELIKFAKSYTYKE
ncbi:ABC transporter substrate-binding protein [Chloroflexota bacterium]